jgi:hypothetical protein
VVVMVVEECKGRRRKSSELLDLCRLLYTKKRRTEGGGRKRYLRRRAREKLVRADSQSASHLVSKRITLRLEAVSDVRFQVSEKAKAARTLERSASTSSQRGDCGELIRQP